MRRSFSGRFRRPAEFLRRQFLLGGGLPLADVLSAELVRQVLTAVGAVWYDRVYTPLVTLWLLPGQVLSPDQSCRVAVARLNAHRAARGGAAVRDRRNAELDLTSSKRTVQMDVLRCKTPDLVRKEVWAHVLAYNLVRA